MSNIKQHFEVGELVILDKGFNNSSVVEVVSQTPDKVFTKVTYREKTWQVMTYRLAKINKRQLFELPKIDGELVSVPISECPGVFGLTYPALKKENKCHTS